MSALTDEILRAELIVHKTPQEATDARRRGEKAVGRRLPVTEHEAKLYGAAGLTPPD
ncbi:hypothetical protein GOEFS_110_00100 [Gordonia effusa NBRC 100432]|uniref:Uncharacterized protein n=1 Tax=Gordonia effusa NBRC 100432 TaxID=1077974 RepID=H0R5D1_9ACTN|nr:hypothetical protein [Gordonia effusa]GAB20282.1 hypothetical protein GOEFS_110_00100 [Gordonia effusa NBRC 100432]